MGQTPFMSLGALAGDSTASLNAFTGVIRARVEALMRMVSPVAGLRPIRAARATFANLANPAIATGSPFDTTAVTTSVNPSRTAVTVLKSTSLWTATAFASSRLFIAGHSPRKLPAAPMAPIERAVSESVVMAVPRRVSPLTGLLLQRRSKRQCSTMRRTQELPEGARRSESADVRSMMLHATADEFSLFLKISKRDRIFALGECPWPLDIRPGRPGSH